MRYIEAAYFLKSSEKKIFHMDAIKITELGQTVNNGSYHFPLMTEIKDNQELYAISWILRLIMIMCISLMRTRLNKILTWPDVHYFLLTFDISNLKRVYLSYKYVFIHRYMFFITCNVIFIRIIQHGGKIIMWLS